MSLADLNTTPTHERGIVHHVTFPHPKRDLIGTIIVDENGEPVIDRVEPLFNDGKPVELIIAGPDSDQVSRGQLKTFDIQRRADFDGRPVTVAESIEGNVSRWCAALIGWKNLPSGWVDKLGKDDPIAYSEANAKAMFAQTGMAWLGQQIDGVLVERNRFLPQGSLNSEPTPSTSSAPQKPANRHRSRAS